MSEHLLGWAACKYYGPCLHVWQQLLPVLAECETSEPLATAGQFSAPGEPSLNHTVLWLQAMLVLCTRSLAEELYWQMVQTPAPATTTFQVSNCPTDRESTCAWSLPHLCLLQACKQIQERQRASHSLVLTTWMLGSDGSSPASSACVSRIDTMSSRRSDKLSTYSSTYLQQTCKVEYPTACMNSVGHLLL